MSFTLTPVEAPTTVKGPNEYDQLVADVIALQSSGQWGSLPVLAADADAFKRKYREAANRAGHSAKFAADGKQDKDGNVLLTFTVQDKITRTPKPAAPAAAETAPTEAPAA